MPEGAWFWFLSGGAVAACLLAAVRPLLRWQRARTMRHALATFRTCREQLEARFFDMASRRGIPRGVRWHQCDFLGPVEFARDRATGLITAFVSINVSFEAIPGSDMEDVQAVGLLRDACALFHYQHGAWGTGGRALFNMNPHDAVQRLAVQYEPLPAGR